MEVRVLLAEHNRWGYNKAGFGEWRRMTECMNECWKIIVNVNKSSIMPPNHSANSTSESVPPKESVLRRLIKKRRLLVSSVIRAGSGGLATTVFSMSNIPMFARYRKEGTRSLCSELYSPVLWIRIRMFLAKPKASRIRHNLYVSGSFPHRAKIVQGKPWFLLVCDFLMTFLYLKSYVNIFLKSNKLKYESTAQVSVQYFCNCSS